MKFSEIQCLLTMDVNFGRSSKGRPTVIHCTRCFIYEASRQCQRNHVLALYRIGIVSLQSSLTTRGPHIINIQNEQHTNDGNGSMALARKAVANMKSAMDGIEATPSSSQGTVSGNLTDDVLMQYRMQSMQH